MIEIVKNKDMDRRCHNCLRDNPEYELHINEQNARLVIVLCKECLKELNLLFGAVLERDK